MLVGASGVTAFVGNKFGASDAAGVQLSEGRLGLVILEKAVGADAKWAMIASGNAEVVGVSGLKLSGGLDLRMNRYGDPVDETISTLDGDVRVYFTTGDSLTQIAGNLRLETPVASLSGDFTAEATGNSPNREILFSATNVSAFVGDTKGTASTADDIGVRFSGGSLVGYIAPDSTYAFDASGTAAIVGVSDLTLTGTLSAQKNTTG
ncbi:MAG: hypothetical protein ACKPJD_03990, partial [Planctomycetaceae bacterium]